MGGKSVSSNLFPGDGVLVRAAVDRLCTVSPVFTLNSVGLGGCVQSQSVTLTSEFHQIRLVCLRSATLAELISFTLVYVCNSTGSTVLCISLIAAPADKQGFYFCRVSGHGTSVQPNSAQSRSNETGSQTLKQCQNIWVIFRIKHSMCKIKKRQIQASPPFLYNAWLGNTIPLSVVRDSVINAGNLQSCHSSCPAVRWPVLAAWGGLWTRKHGAKPQSSHSTIQMQPVEF